MQKIKISSIERNILNPRKNFDSTKLKELADSIKEVGIIEPLVVSAYDPGHGDGELRFRIIAGERRWKAATLAGLDKVPCIVKFDLTPDQEIRLALTENLQRQDLNPIEEARAYRLLLDMSKEGRTQESLADELGVSQAHIANRIRLLELPDSVQENISREIISPSHGRVLAGYKNLPAPVLKKAVEAIIEKRVPVAKTDEAIACVIGEIGKPLFNDYSSKPEFKTEQCEECEFRVMGRRYSHDETEYPYCVKPSCWEKKQQEVRQAREQSLADKAQKAAKKGQGVVDLSKFKWDQYEEFAEYKTKGLDLSECKECEHKKVAKSYGDKLTEACFMPSCFKKKQAAATREKNKQARTAFQVELEKIAGLANAIAYTCRTINMPRPVLVYLAAQVLANVTNNYERGKTRYHYVKDKFGWDDGFFKSTAYHSLGSEWESFRSRLELLTEWQLWEIIFEWPAVAEGLTGIRSWMLEEGLLSDYEMQLDYDPDGHGTCRVCGCTDDMACLGGCYWVEPDLCSRCVEAKGGADEEHESSIEKDLDKFLVNQDAADDNDAQAPEPKTYLDQNQGREVFVSKGLWGKDGQTQYGTFWRSPSGGLHRVKSPAMPMVATREEAQANLDAWAEKKGLQLVEQRSGAA